MTTLPPPALGTIGWVDLTVPDAVAVRDFYAQVTGWSPTALSMGEYEDFVMSTPDGTGVGTMLTEPRGAGGTARFAVIQDPAGATVARFDSGIRNAA